MKYLKTFENHKSRKAMNIARMNSGNTMIEDMEEYMGKKINQHFTKQDPMVDNAIMVWFDGGSDVYDLFSLNPDEAEKKIEEFPKLKEWAAVIWYEREKDMEGICLWESLKYAPQELLDILGVDRDDLPKATYSPKFF